MKQRVLQISALLVLMAGTAEGQQTYDGLSGNTRMTGTQARALANLRDLRSLRTDESGIPVHIEAELGSLRTGVQGFDADSRALLSRLRTLYRLDGTERLRFRKTDVDGRTRHVRVDQTIDGLEVIGGDAALHLDETTGRVTSIDSHLLSGRALPRTELVNAQDAYSQALKMLGAGTAHIAAGPRLAFARTPNGKGYLVWDADVEYVDAEGARHLDRLLLDTQTGAEVWRIARVHSALYRVVRDFNTSAFLMDEVNPGVNPGPHAQAVFANSGTTYNFYWNVFGRDSWNGAGAQMEAYVHGSALGPANAAFSNNVASFGDGNSAYAPFGLALDIVAHEWTHGVTQSEAGLVYDQGESGGLNEAFSDILGAATEAFQTGVGASTWMIGEAVYTPTVPGDAFRYMNDPARDGASRDFYPDLPASIDQHYSSGVANLAFFLTSQGGTHPRGRTSLTVNGIGIAQAQRIYYLALRDQLLSTSGFSAARNATAVVARQQYGINSSQHLTVCRAWSAVGVPNDFSQCNLPPLAIYESAHCGPSNTIAWDPMPGANSYELWMSSSPTNFSNATRVYAGPLTETEIFQSVLAYTKVKACYDDGCGALGSGFARVQNWSDCS